MIPQFLLLLAVAQTTPPSADAAPASPVAVAAPGGPAAAACCAVPTGTLIEIAVDAALDSKTSKIGDTFPIRVAVPLMMDGRTVIPAGTTGQGEVIHVAKARAMGKAGELMLVARYLTINGAQVPLRGFRLGGAGRDNTGTAVLLAATVSTLMPFAIVGGEKRVAPGALATAKIAADVQLAPLASAPDPKLPTGETVK